MALYGKASLKILNLRITLKMFTPMRYLELLWNNTHTVYVTMFDLRYMWVDLSKPMTVRGQKLHSSACNYEWNLERTSNSSQSTRPVGKVLWEELLDEVIINITPLCSLLHKLLKDKCMCLQDEWKLLSHSSCRTSAILKYFCPLTVYQPIPSLHIVMQLLSWINTCGVYVTLT